MHGALKLPWLRSAGCSFTVFFKSVNPFGTASFSCAFRIQISQIGSTEKILSKKFKKKVQRKVQKNVEKKSSNKKSSKIFLQQKVQKKVQKVKPRFCASPGKRKLFAFSGLKPATTK